MAVAAQDWRDPDAYARLLPGDRRCFAWEWLRRTPAYCEAWAVVNPPTPFGLVRLEDPARDAVAARPVWSRSIDRAVLYASAGADDPAERLPLASLAPIATMVSVLDAPTSFLFSDGLHSIRVDIDSAWRPGEAITPVWHIAGLMHVKGQLTALAQLTALSTRGAFARSLHPPERRAKRWIAMLRVHDALTTGASTREIVAELFDVSTTSSRWRTSAASWRLQAQRLAAAGRRCLSAGPSLWLRADDQRP